MSEIQQTPTSPLMKLREKIFPQSEIKVIRKDLEKVFDRLLFLSLSFFLSDLELPITFNFLCLNRHCEGPCKLPSLGTFQSHVLRKKYYKMVHLNLRQSFYDWAPCSFNILKIRHINLDDRWSLQWCFFAVREKKIHGFKLSKLLFQRKLPKPDLSTKTEAYDSTVPRKTKGCLTKILSQYKKPYVASTRYWLILKKKKSNLNIIQVPMWQWCHFKV